MLKSCKVSNQSLVTFDTSVVCQIGLLEFRLSILFRAWISNVCKVPVLVDIC